MKMVTSMATLYIIVILLQPWFLSVAATGSEEDCECQRNWWEWWSQPDWEDWCDVYESHNITRDVSEDAIPLTFLQIWFGDKFVNPGDIISPLDTTSAPRLVWLCDDRKFYTMMLLSIDAPTTNKGDQYVIWRVEGISDCDMSTGTTVAPYKPLIPGEGLGTHRYFVVMFEQAQYTPHTIVNTLVKGTAGGLDFSLGDYIEENCPPIAGNFFIEEGILLGDTNLAPFASELPLGAVTKEKEVLDSLIP